MEGRMDIWMDEQMEERIDGRMNRWMGGLDRQIRLGYRTNDIKDKCST